MQLVEAKREWIERVLHVLAYKLVQNIGNTTSLQMQIQKLTNTAVRLSVC